VTAFAHNVVIGIHCPQTVISLDLLDIIFYVKEVADASSAI
jgi:hypothetical protein